MEKIEKFLSNYFWVVICIISIPSIWALFVPGFYGASDDLHIGWLYEMMRALQTGQFPPRYVPDLSFGFGYPLFNFVFPLPFYIGGVFHSLGLSLVDSVKAVFFVSLPVSAIFMYLLLREFSSPIVSLAGATVYLFTPYRSTDVYVRGDIGESLSFIFLPLITLSIIKLTPQGKNSWIGWGALSIAALILTHNITSYMFVPFVVLLAFFLKDKLAWWKLGLTFMGGLLISLFFWLPALLDSGLMKYDTVFNFVDHFPTLKQLITPYWGYGASVPGPGDGMSFFIGIINWVLFVLALLFSFKAKKTILFWSLISFIVAFLMMNQRSTFIWNHVPLLPYFQFPWRFLIITTFCSSIFVICLEKFKLKNILALIVIVSVVLINWSFFRPQDFLGRTDQYYLNRYIPVPTASSQYMTLQEEYLRLPKNTQVRPDKNFPLVTPQDVVKVTQLNPLDSQISISTTSAFTLNYNKYLFLGWSASLDGKVITLLPGTPYGQISTQVPAGEHTLSISFDETVRNRLLDIVSLSGLVVCISLIVKRK